MNITGKYLKVWKIEDGEYGRKVDLGEGRKNQDGTYSNFTWFGARIVGNAKAVQIAEGDTVEVKSGIIEMRKGGDKWYTNITIFEIEVMSKGQPKQPSQAQVVSKVFEDDENIPF